MRFTFQSSVAQSSKYRLDIDGLRAIAVLPVLFYHAGLSAFSGGYVGVDIFFVISGYLITSLITRDINQGSFSIVSFYERRIRRIFPALYSMAFVFTIIGAVIFAPKDFARFGKSFIAMAFFVSNIFFRREAQLDGYFGDASDKEPLLHTWSLSVEEQFYVFFPITLFLIHRWAKGREVILLSIALLVTFLLSAWGVRHRPAGTFYLLLPRSWELLVGALLALHVIPTPKNRIVREISGVIGLAAIAWAVFTFDKNTLFPGLNALFPCLGAALIIYSGAQEDTFVKRFLSFWPIVFIGVISYSLYLWHWPLIVFAKYFAAGALNNMDKTAIIAASLVLAFISFEFIESPFRGKNSRFARRQIFSYGFAASVASLAIGLIIVSLHGVPGRYAAQTQRLVIENSDREEDFNRLYECSSFRKKIRGIKDIALCKIGNQSKRNIFFWGDSHVEQLYSVVKKLYDNGDLHEHGALFAVAAACAPAEHLNLSARGYHCDAYSHYAMMRAAQDDVDTVYIGFSAWWSLADKSLCLSVDGRCQSKITQNEIRNLFIKDLSDQIRELKAHGKRVIIALPFPMFDKSIPTLEIRNAIFGKYGLAGKATDKLSPALRDQVIAAAKSTGAEIFDPRASLCKNQQCVYEVDGVSIYKDSNHLAASGVDILEDNLKQVLK